MLIVCDEPVTLKSCADVVGREGHQAVVTSSGEEALTLLEHQPVDLALLFLDKLDLVGGVEAIALLAAFEQRRLLPALPVLAVTAPGRGTLRNDLRHVGVIDFLSQPIEEVELGCRIRTLNELRSLRERTQQREPVDAAWSELGPNYRTILETAGEGAWIIDAEARTTFVNQRMAEMLGVGVEEMVDAR